MLTWSVTVLSRIKFTGRRLVNQKSGLKMKNGHVLISSVKRCPAARLTFSFLLDAPAGKYGRAGRGRKRAF